jgi:leucyl-tRNA synthetase
MEKRTVSVLEYKILLQLLSVFAPHMTEEIWHELGETESIHLSVWPTWDKEKIIDQTMTLAIQVSGKVRAEMTVNRELSEDEIKAEALNHESIRSWTADKEIQRIIYVPGRLVNIVI